MQRKSAKQSNDANTHTMSKLPKKQKNAKLKRVASTTAMMQILTRRGNHSKSPKQQRYQHPNDEQVAKNSKDAKPTRRLSQQNRAKFQTSTRLASHQNSDNVNQDNYQYISPLTVFNNISARISIPLEKAPSTRMDVHTVDKTHHPVVATLAWGFSGQKNLGDLNFLKLRVEFINANNIEGLNAYGAYISGSGCYAYDFYNRTKRAQIVDGNGCGLDALPFQLSANQQTFTFDIANTAPANGTPNDFKTASFEMNSFETTKPGPHIVTVECQIAFCYNSTDPRCFSGNTCQGGSGRRRRETTDPVELQTVQATIIINDNPKKDTTCLEGSVFIAVTTVLALLILMAFALAIVLCVILVTRRNTPKV
ncbi:hypothetical protein CHS0354_015997 [Potamilus streckersoni]|uniref:ZP domain-containing protein n=1 Tax=Potamilus streckersoni TaxID=2493646 RepID=A0AAE0SYE8_9BIVA|nr:hypothetical protein CHS0354_015997 [Potamilus streckersoni]